MLIAIMLQTEIIEMIIGEIKSTHIKKKKNEITVVKT